MRNQENIKAMPRHLFLSLKGIRFHYVLPLLVMYLLIPCMAYLDYLSDGLDAAQSAIIENTQILLPFFSVWWLIFIFRTYVESDGNELLYIYNGKIKLFECLCLLMVYLAHAALSYAVYSSLFSGMWMEFLRLAIECLFYAGVTYALLYGTKSIALTLMPVLIYTFLCYIASAGRDYVFPAYICRLPATWGVLGKIYLPLFLVALFFLGIGYWCNHRMETYH